MYYNYEKLSQKYLKSYAEIKNDLKAINQTTKFTSVRLL